MEPAPSFSRWFHRREGLLFHLICGLYFLAISPRVVAAARGAEAPAFWLGGLLLLAMILEVRALPEKMKFVNFAIRGRRQGDASSGGLFFLWMFHAVISILVLFHAVRQFGVEISPKEGSTDLPVWLSALMPLIVIKELYLLTAIWLGKGHDLPAGRYTRPNPREGFCDFVLIAYACLAYSVTWGMISGAPLDPANPGRMLVNGFAATLLFLIFYLPMRIPYFLEEWTAIETRRDRFRFLGSLLLALIPALWSLT
jgi:hypothetical protein